jgi:hypothetical protein
MRLRRRAYSNIADNVRRWFAIVFAAKPVSRFVAM